MYKQIVIIDDNVTDNYVNEYMVKAANVAETVTVKNSAVNTLKFLESLKKIQK